VLATSDTPPSLLSSQALPPLFSSFSPPPVSASRSFLPLGCQDERWMGCCISRASSSSPPSYYSGFSLFLSQMSLPLNPSVHLFIRCPLLFLPFQGCSARSCAASTIHLYSNQDSALFSFFLLLLLLLSLPPFLPFFFFLRVCPPLHMLAANQDGECVRRVSWIPE